jgi:membrane protein
MRVQERRGSRWWREPREALEEPFEGGRPDRRPDGGEDPKGRTADAPTQIPPRGWLDVLKRTWAEQTKDNMGLIAAGVAFYFLLALAPALAAFVSIVGLVLDPADVQAQVQELSGVIPQAGREVVFEQLTRLVSQPAATLGVSFVVALALALWSSMNATKSLITALNIAYEEDERRGFVRLNLSALLLTLGAIVFLAVSIGLIAVVPGVLERVGLDRFAKSAIDILRWPALAILVLLGLAVVYRHAPSRARPKWRWVSPGSLTATGLWLVASGLFSLYVSKWGSYNETYGSLAAVVILMLWLYLTAYTVLIGAELNAELEHQTAKDSTTGQPRPLGARDAYVADHVAP